MVEAPFTDDQLRVLSLLTDRVRLGRMMDTTFDGRRDLYQIFGYKDSLTPADYQLRYERGGIAGTIVDGMPKAAWRGGVQLVENEKTQDETTAFEKEWVLFDKRLEVTSRLLQVNILSRLSYFAVLLIGAPGDDVTQPLERGNGSSENIAYLRSYSGNGGPSVGVRRSEALTGISETTVSDARIATWDEDHRSPRFGQPIGYQLRRTNFSSPNAFSDVIYHWTRILHVAESPLFDDIYGEPALRRPWNRLDDLEKVIGGGSESFFQRANQGRVWSLDKDAKGITQPQIDDFKEQIEKFEHQIIRDVRTQGMDVKTLSSDVAQFGPNADAIMTQLAGITRYPKRILTGSEMGELASSQDRDNWRDQVNGYRETHCAPRLLYRFVNRLIEFNYLPKPVSYNARWGAVLNLTEDEKRTKALGWAQTNQALAQANQPPAFLMQEIRDQCYEMAPYDPQQLTDEQGMMPAPEPVAAPAFPRAAELERLTVAIEHNDTDTIDEIIGVTHASD